MLIHFKESDLYDMEVEWFDPKKNCRDLRLKTMDKPSEQELNRKNQTLLLQKYLKEDKGNANCISNTLIDIGILLGMVCLEASDLCNSYVLRAKTLGRPKYLSLLMRSECFLP